MLRRQMSTRTVVFFFLSLSLSLFQGVSRCLFSSFVCGITLLSSVELKKKIIIKELKKKTRRGKKEEKTQFRHARTFNAGDKDETIAFFFNNKRFKRNKRFCCVVFPFFYFLSLPSRFVFGFDSICEKHYHAISCPHCHHNRTRVVSTCVSLFPKFLTPVIGPTN